MDKPLLILGALLIATMTAFLSGIIHYPYGWLVFSLLLIARVLQLRPSRRHSAHKP